MINPQRHYLHLRKQKATQYHLWRLTEDEYRQLRNSSLPIKIDSKLMLQLMLSERDNPERLSLPKALLSLEDNFGKSSDRFDEWKSSFSFPLLFRLDKPVGRFFYLLRIGDYRGALDFLLYRLLENGADGYDIRTYREPFELEFSRKEINEFICYVYGFLTGFALSTCNRPIEPFIRSIDSNHILYGYRDGEFFEEQIDSQEEYQAAIKAFEEKYGSLQQERQSQNLRSLLEKITGEAMTEK
ncbi:MAG: hypothetical protein F6J86_35410 [Symploca sp. SIO1B1]|nr:hypothetical protein [Symploca sp. SIO1B1]